ncbi:MAG: hypothetical protein K2P70_03570 [Hyphomonadaceae bacterium]|jgi:hypothetical protein|nr:hypothetical protein [Hyphomonadaceae bacterium]
MEWGVNEWVAVGSAVLALASLVLNWLVVRRQTELQYETLRAEMDAEVIGWSQDAIDQVSEAITLASGRGTAYASADFSRLAHETAQKLSSIADRGRLFFPNEEPDRHGQEKEAAFQGFRPPILDAIIFACGRLSRMSAEGGPDKESADFLVKCRRLLVSEAQNAIDPRRRKQMMRRLAVGRKDDKVSAFSMASDLGEAMEALYPGFLDRPRGPAWVAEREAIARRALGRS